MSKMEPTATDVSTIDTDQKGIADERIDTDLKGTIDERIQRFQVQGVDRALEKKLLWKLDTRIIPLLAVMYLFK